MTREKLGQIQSDVVNEHVNLTYTLVLVQRTALSILTQHWTDNISTNFTVVIKNCCVFVSNMKCSHINIYSYHDPVT